MLAYHIKLQRVLQVPFNALAFWQVSYISMFSEASDRTRFSNFFRTIPSDGGFGPAIVSLLHLFNWERIAVFTQQDGLFNEVAAHLHHHPSHNTAPSALYVYISIRIIYLYCALFCL